MFSMFVKRWNKSIHHRFFYNTEAFFVWSCDAEWLRGAARPSVEYWNAARARGTHAARTPPPLTPLLTEAFNILTGLNCIIRDPIKVSLLCETESFVKCRVLLEFLCESFFFCAVLAFYKRFWFFYILICLKIEYLVVYYRMLILNVADA